MAIILKPNKTFVDRSGVAHTEAYGVIDEFLKLDKRRRRAHFRLDIYKDQNSIAQGFQKVDAKPYEVSGEEFDQYFSPLVITADDNEYKQAYLCLLSMVNKENELIWKDWQSDES